MEKETEERQSPLEGIKRKGLVRGERGPKGEGGQLYSVAQDQCKPETGPS